MAKSKKNNEYYDIKLKGLEEKRKKLNEEEKKAKEWKIKHITKLMENIQISEENSLLDIITEDNFKIFEKHFKNLAKEMEEQENRKYNEEENSQSIKNNEDIKKVEEEING